MLNLIIKLNIIKTLNEKYGIRIRDHITKINEYKKKKSESTEIDMARFNFIYNGSMIYYLMKVPLNKIKELFSVDIPNYFETTKNRTEKNAIEQSINRKYKIVMNNINT